MDGTSNNTFRYNVSQNDFDRGGRAFSIPFGGGSLAVYNNTFYRSQGQTGRLTTSNSAGVATYSNNVFVNAGTATGGYDVGGGAVYASNTFFGANSSMAPHTGKLTSDPLLSAPGTATSIGDAAAAYALGSASPSRDSGVSIANNGGLDFAGRALYQGLPDRGAVEGPPAAVLSSEHFTAGALGGWATGAGAWTVGGTPEALRQSSLAGEALATVGSASWADYTATARIAVTTPSGNGGLLLRYTDAANFQLLRLNLATAKLELYTKVGGVLTLAASQPYTVAPGEFVSLRADVRGSVVDGWVDGVKVLSWTNPSATPAAGKVGVRSAASAIVVDEVIVRG